MCTLSTAIQTWANREAERLLKSLSLMLSKRIIPDTKGSFHPNHRLRLSLRHQTRCSLTTYIFPKLIHPLGKMITKRNESLFTKRTESASEWMQTLESKVAQCVSVLIIEI